MTKSNYWLRLTNANKLVWVLAFGMVHLNANQISQSEQYRVVRNAKYLKYIYYRLIIMLILLKFSKRLNTLESLNIDTFAWFDFENKNRNCQQTNKQK